MKGFVTRLERERESGKLQARGRTVLATYLFVKTRTYAAKNGDDAVTRFIGLGM